MADFCVFESMPESQALLMGAFWKSQQQKKDHDTFSSMSQLHVLLSNGNSALGASGGPSRQIH